MNVGQSFQLFQPCKVFLVLQNHSYTNFYYHENQINKFQLIGYVLSMCLGENGTFSEKSHNNFLGNFPPGPEPITQYKPRFRLSLQGHFCCVCLLSDYLIKLELLHNIRIGRFFTSHHSRRECCSLCR